MILTYNYLNILVHLFAIIFEKYVITTTTLKYTRTNSLDNNLDMLSFL